MHARGSRHDEREPLDRARRGPARAAAATPRTSPTARSRTCCAGRCARTSCPRWRSSPTARHADRRRSCSSGSSAPTRRERSQHLLRHRRCPRRLQRRRDRAHRRRPELRPGRSSCLHGHDLHHRARAPPGALRAADRRVAWSRSATPSTVQAAKRRPRRRMLWVLDEFANIAPIHDLPALVSQAGGQHLQVMVGLQDLGQARTRWGDAAADGFMPLFQTRLILKRDRRQPGRSSRSPWRSANTTGNSSPTPPARARAVSGSARPARTSQPATRHTASGSPSPAISPNSPTATACSCAARPGASSN